MNPAALCSVIGVSENDLLFDPDGPALFLPEITALLKGKLTWLPFLASRILASEKWLGPDCTICNDCVDGNKVLPLQPAQHINAVYFGVPTIMENMALFQAPGWTKQRACHAAWIITDRAIKAGAKLIVSELSSGSISPEERIADMAGGEIIAMKKFSAPDMIDFTNWLIVRRI